MDKHPSTNSQGACDEGGHDTANGNGEDQDRFDLIASICPGPERQQRSTCHRIRHAESNQLRSRRAQPDRGNGKSNRHGSNGESNRHGSNGESNRHGSNGESNRHGSNGASNRHRGSNESDRFRRNHRACADDKHHDVDDVFVDWEALRS